MKMKRIIKLVGKLIKQEGKSLNRSALGKASRNKRSKGYN